LCCVLCFVFLHLPHTRTTSHQQRPLPHLFQQLPSTLGAAPRGNKTMVAPGRTHGSRHATSGAKLANSPWLPHAPCANNNTATKPIMQHATRHRREASARRATLHARSRPQPPYQPRAVPCRRRGHARTAGQEGRAARLQPHEQRLRRPNARRSRLPLHAVHSGSSRKRGASGGRG